MFVVGQKVRLLTQKGEGVITQIIDKKTIEVDLGDDFPVEFHIDEVIAIDRKEQILLPKVEKEEKKEEFMPVKMGIHLMELSLTLSSSSTDSYELHIINPEKWEVQYVCHVRIKNKYEFLSAGQIKSNGYASLGFLSIDRLEHCKELHFQFLHYLVGTGLPQAPMEKNFAWNMSLLEKEAIYVELIRNDAWIFSLRDNNSKPESIEADGNVERLFVKYAKQEVKLQPPTKIVDLHIEKVLSDTRGMDNAAMLFAQIQAFEKELSEAVVENPKSLIVIHGVGEGKLKAKIHEKLATHPKVKRFSPANLLKFGGGATEIWFKD